MMDWFPQVNRLRKSLSSAGKLTKSSRTSGFSLIELLVVIAIIGVFAAISVPSLVNLSSEAAKAKNQRNAQTIASLANAAKGAGATNAFDTENVIPALVAGINIKGLHFSISPLGESEIEGAKQFLTNSAPSGSVWFVLQPE